MDISCREIICAKVFELQFLFVLFNALYFLCSMLLETGGEGGQRQCHLIILGVTGESNLSFLDSIVCLFVCLFVLKKGYIGRGHRQGGRGGWGQKK